MRALHRLAETRIREAIDRGDFDDLPGKGRPQRLDDLSRVPADLRAGYILLKNANVLPEELELRKETLTLEDLIRACGEDDAQRAPLQRRLNARLMRINMLAEERLRGAGWRDYGGRVLARLARR